MTHSQETVRALYKKLLALYPRAFREQLGESMAQTFDDLCDERRRQTERGWLGFVLGMFVETAIGIAQEHMVVIAEMSPMKHMLTSVRLPAIIGFLIILPFMLLELTFMIVKRLQFDLRDALDSFAVFGFLWLGVAGILLILIPIVRNMRAGNASMADSLLARGNTIFTNPTSAAIISFLLALPFMTILSLLLLNIQPPLGALEPLLNKFGSFIVLGMLLLAIAACLIAREPIVRTMQAGGSLFTHRINLILAVVTLSFLAILVVGLTVDQFPCWIGVPNCD